MAHTYHQMYVQTVFAVKYRNAVIEKQWSKRLFAVIGRLINDTGSKCLIVNGVMDHVHCLFAFKPSVNVSDVMKVAKAKSSLWLNDSDILLNRFEWQTGFAAFTYNHSDIQRVYKYIANQEEHHKHQYFKEEIIGLFLVHGVKVDPKYIFDDLI